MADKNMIIPLYYVSKFLKYFASTENPMNQRSAFSRIPAMPRFLACKVAGLASAVPSGTIQGHRIHQHTPLGALALAAMMLAGLLLPAPAQDTAAPTPKTEGAPSKPPTPPAGKDEKPNSDAPPAAAPDKEPGKPFKLPGLVIDTEKRCVDVEASICLEDGALELIACTKDTKEHESIVVVAARPIHIHAALLLLGAKNGNPAMRRPLNKEQTRWMDLPARGDLISVSLEYKDIENKTVERPISDFIARTQEVDKPAGEQPDAEKAERFPNSFLFAGSQLFDNEKGQRDYIADQSGNVISIASFGDEVLCLPDMYSQENGSLVWSIDSTHLPKLGTKVTLRLSLKKKPEIIPPP
jgi:hypothetical protein